MKSEKIRIMLEISGSSREYPDCITLTNHNSIRPAETGLNVILSSASGDAMVVDVVLKKSGKLRIIQEKSGLFLYLLEHVAHLSTVRTGEDGAGKVAPGDGQRHSLGVSIFGFQKT